MARFDQLLNILKISFESGISESQYHSIVNMIREYGASPDSKDIEHASLKAIGWPNDYHPSDHIERIRFAFHFVPYKNEQVDKYIESFK
jgi:hypothetical protein